MATGERVPERRSTFINDSPHFFKVVFAPVSQGLRIPTSFMNKYGDSLNNINTVVLQIPTGDSCRVQLRRTDSGTWLGEGWKEFALYYAIKPCDFLVFRYDRGSKFDVMIFDPSASEIRYPVESSEEGDEVEILDPEPEICERQNMVKVASVGVKEKKEYLSYQRAEAFTSENPFFLCFMQPSHVSNRYLLTLNLRSVGDVFPRNKRSCKLQLRVAGGRNKVWELSCNMYWKPQKANILRGWKYFAVDNDLRVGDVCVFESVKGTLMEFDITIFRNS